MKRNFIALFALLAFTILLAQPSDYLSLQTEAEKYYAERSYSRAHELYQKAEGLSLTSEQTRWVAFRLADTEWRSQASTETADPTKFEEAQRALEKLVRDVERTEDRDRIWAEVQESLGDFFWTRTNVRNWGQAWTYYERALDWWAGSADIENARQRYLNIVWRASKPHWVEPYYYYGYYGNYVPLSILDNALKIANIPNDKGHVHYLIAMTVRNQGGDFVQRQRIEKEFEAAIDAGKTTDWHDDALYFYAEWLATQGRLVQTEDGQWRNDPDFPKALELFRKLITEYGKGETRYYDQATEQIKNITTPDVSVAVSHLFLPGAEVQFALHWRNVKRVELAIYRVDLSSDVHFAANAGAGEWLQQIRLNSTHKTKSWFKDTQDKGDHRPGQEIITLDTTLPTGAYVVEAVSTPDKARDLILVSDASLVLKSTAKKALVYFCDANNGSPVSAARVQLWERIWQGQNYIWKQRTAETDKDGIALFALESSSSTAELFAGAAQADRQAFATGYGYGYHRQAMDWRIYAFTDRPAYRPEDEVQWKFIARQYDGARYRTPSDTALHYQILDPRGTEVSRQKITLNAFGSAWGSLKLNSTMPLGEYRIIFHEAEQNHQIGSAVLFRLEEYKLPEFKVSIQTPEEDGKRKAFRLGEQIQVNVQADYYFGGPVSNAQVEVLVYQNPFFHWWHPDRDFPWFYQDMNQRNYNAWYGQGQIIKRETLKTDVSGRATLTFDTPLSSQQDFQYRIEARVTDSSRREILGSETLRVTRQRYFVYLHPDHYLYTPADRVKVDIKSLDANENPVPVDGTLKVTRDWWYEAWIDEKGIEVIGDRPPDQKAGETTWRLKSRGYRHEDILTQRLKTDKNGEAQFHFTPNREGYYRVVWTSQDEGSVPVKSETTIWIATGQSAELGYRTSGLEIIVDKDTFRTGQKAPVLLTVPTNDRYVLFSLEGEDLYSYQIVHITGTAKLIELDINETHVPNIFLNGVLVHDRQIHMDSKQVIVPPVENFLQVEIKSDREEYQPREEGLITVTTKDHNGNPVSSEVAVGLSDEAVYYIQKDYAGDPRQFYFGEKRSQRVLTQSTLQHKSYWRKRDQERRDSMNESDFEKLEALGYLADGVEGGVRGGVMGGVAAGMRSYAVDKATIPTAQAAPFPAAPAKEAAAEQLQEPAVQVRTDFRATVFWQPNVITGKEGTATVRVSYPDSLTSWRAMARVASQTNQFGIAQAVTRTKKPLIVRLQAPRFFVVGDTVTISAVINNNTDKDQDVATVLEPKGIVPAAGMAMHQRSKVPARGEARVDWLMSVAQAGSVELSATVRGQNYSDAMQKEYIAFEHGIEKFLATSGKMKEGAIIIKQNIPQERKPESTKMIVQITPSLAVTMLDALPYLIDYPYGCTEQTMSRFLPAAIVAKTLRDLGLSKELIESRVFGGIEPQFAPKTHREGKKDLRKLEEMVQAGLKRLYDFQHADGGWGWWKEGESDHWMSAYVIWGLSLTSKAGISVRADVLSRGVEYLEKELVEEEDHFEIQAWMLHALAYQKKAGNFEKKALDNLWTNRDRLNAYGRALLALSAHYFSDPERAQILIRNLENGAKIDDGSAHWGEDDSWWHWSDGAVESTAFALQALLAINPQHKLVEPVTSWLIKNRRGAQWNNTRDTAITILSLNDYLRKSGELNSAAEFELIINGHRIVTKKIAPKDILSAPSRYAIERKYIQNGDNEISIRRIQGSNPLYFSIETSFFSLEEPIASAGNEIFVRREYYKLAGKPTLLKGYVYDRQPLKDGDSVKSGERVETVLTLQAKNNYEYLVFEDLKPAGLETVAVRSGVSLFARELKSSAKTGAVAESDYTQRTRWVYQELRDRKVALFLDKLPQGTWEIRYDSRAEVPGRFHALPLVGYAMYVPEIRANGEEVRLRVVDE